MSKGDFRPRLKGQRKEMFDFFTTEENRVLVIGDLHEPFCRKGYLQFCKDTYKKFNCNKVVFIGDILDNHFGSYHETDADGLGGGKELEIAIKNISKWYKTFPDAHVTVGNHDAIPGRKAATGGIPRIWIKEYKEVLNTPKWEFVPDVYIDNVRYVHGHKSSKARTAAKRDMKSTVTGHFHTDFYIEWFFGIDREIFGMAVGCGIDSKSYAMSYMQGGKKEAIGCGVVLGGHTPILVKMDLKKYK